MLQVLLMLINFIGSFNSGKTTLAAKLFAALKESNLTCEFIPEQARFYIAEKRITNKLNNIVLNNIDQLNILIKQFEAEKLMLNSCDRDTIIITDSSIYNSLLYMDDDFIEKFADNTLIDITNYYDKYNPDNIMTFICDPVINTYSNTPDKNRIHTQEHTDKINNRLDKLFGYYKIPRLSGDIKSRFNTSYLNIIDKLNDLKIIQNDYR